MVRLGVVVLGLLLVTSATAAESPSFLELEESLTCQCGCGLTVHACNHLQCPSAIPLRQEIRAQMEKGLSKDAILQYFADKYGEKILSSPTTTGFNLTAWVVPFVVVALGSIFVVFTLFRWRRGKRRPAAPVVVSQPVGDPAQSAHEKILERELKQFDA